MVDESAAPAALFVMAGSIVGPTGLMLQSGMVLDGFEMAHQRGMRIVLDDRSRLPWRFFGRLTTAALAV
jgi:hypothetical protein